MTEEQQALLQKLYTEQQLADSNLSVLQQQLEFTQVLLNRYQTGLQVLQELEGKEEGEEMLMNVSGGILLRATLSDPKNVTRVLGGGVRLETSLEEAKKAVEQSVENLEKQYQALAQEYQKMIDHSALVNAQFRQLAEQMQASGEK
ncbi:MAG: prefoldin subunit alpha [Candidatus Hodarchaeota archaeon]